VGFVVSCKVQIHLVLYDKYFYFVYDGSYFVEYVHFFFFKLGCFSYVLIDTAKWYVQMTNHGMADEISRVLNYN